MSRPFDTLKFARALRGEGKFTAAQADGIAEAFAEAMGEPSSARAELSDFGPVTRADLGLLESDLRADKTALRTDFMILKWMSALNLAMVFMLLLLRTRRG